jgi:hypothetical protein
LTEPSARPVGWARVGWLLALAIAISGGAAGSVWAFWGQSWPDPPVLVVPPLTPVAPPPPVAPARTIAPPARAPVPPPHPQVPGIHPKKAKAKPAPKPRT